jgi:predicted membrane protein
MSEEKKFKKYYVYLIAFFLLTNIIAVFFVFKKYRNFNKQENKIASAKIKFSELKEKLESVVDSTQVDSAFYNNLYTLKSEIVQIDSLLMLNQLSQIHLDDLQVKIDDFVVKANRTVEDSVAM